MSDFKRFLLAAPVLMLGVLGTGPALAELHTDPNDTTRTSTTHTVEAYQQEAQTTQAVGAAFGRLDFLNVQPEMASGLSSGEGDMGINLWINPYYSYADDDNVSTGYDADTIGVFFGGDYKFSDRLTVGLMFGFDNTDIESKVNGGGSDTDGFTVAPYARFNLTKTYSVDGTVGYTNSNSDSDRLVSGTRITGSSDTDRFFGGANINASFWDKRWNYLAKVGTTFARDNRDGYTESNGSVVGGSNTWFGQAQIGGTVSYYFENIRPWINATYAYDYTRKLPSVAAGQVEPSNDRDQLVLGIGATVFGYGRIMGDLNVKQTLFKQNYTNTQVGATLSMRF